MKILHVGPVYAADSSSGVHQSVLGWTSAQAAIGMEVALLSSVPLPEGRIRIDLPGVTLLHGLERKHYNPWLVSDSWLTQIRSEFGTPDIVHFHTINNPFQSALARKLRKHQWPYVITPHGEASHMAQRTKRIKKKLANLLAFKSYVKNASAVHALCLREAEQIEDHFPVQKTIVVSNGVDGRLFDLANHLQPANLDGFADSDDIVLGFVGRIDMHIKGLDLLLEALAKLRQFPHLPDVKLFMIGNFHTDKDRRAILSAIQSMKLGDMVKVYGPKFGEEKWKYFLACDVFVHTSRTEGMPMSVIEAMALQRPCLVTPQTNMSGIVRDAGGWVTSTDSDAIVATLRNICNSRNLFHGIGARSRDICFSRLRWSLIATQMEAEYIKICRGDC